MKELLTDRQKQILEFIKTFTADNSRPPTFRDIADEFGYRSINAVTDHLHALERKNAIKRDAHVSRGIELVDRLEEDEIPILGRIAAGAPVLAEENREGTLSFSDMARPDFALRVYGESMKDAGIIEGDLVLVKVQQTAEHRDIVVAMTEDGETTVKRLLKTNKRIILHPENETMEDIIPQGDLKVIGKVIGVVRKM